MPGGRSTNLEFLAKLRDLFGITSTREFARVCGKRPANMGAYLRGDRPTGERFLRSCVENIANSKFGWRIEAEREVCRIERASSVPKSGGVYVLYDSGGNVLYIGKAKDLKAEVSQTLGRSVPPGGAGLRFGPDLKRTKITLRELAQYVSIYLIEDARLRHNVEALLLRIFVNQTHNSSIGEFK